MHKLIAGSFAAAAAAIAPALAQSEQHWSAVDRITLTSTGALTIAGDRMSFGTDGSIHVELVAAHIRGRWSETNERTEGDIYKVDPPAKPTSPRGDVLCDQPATYIVLSYPVPGDLDLSVYTASDRPKGDGSDKACATFSYTEG